MKKQRLPDERPSRTHKVRFGPDDSLNLVVGFSDEGRILELFAYAYRQGSREAGLLDSLCLAISIGLQHGVPLAEFCEKLRHQSFEPHGMTSNRQIPQASSYSDYLAQYLPQLEERMRAAVAAQEQEEFAAGTLHYHAVIDLALRPCRKDVCPEHTLTVEQVESFEDEAIGGEDALPSLVAAD